MTDPKTSPAVLSLLNAQAERENSKEIDDLEAGLEQTFPASDPVSATHSSAAGIKAEPDRSIDSEYPLVEEALRSAGGVPNENDADYVEDVAALQRDVSRLADKVGEVAGGTAYLARRRASSWVTGVEDTVRERPLAAVGLIAALAYLWGATR